MKFTTPCFVRVENPQERKELDMWLKSIGMERVSHSKTDRAPWFTLYKTGRYEQNNGFCTPPEMARYNGYVDCGTNIPLFKALAAMNDENDREQWFRVDRSFPGRYDMVGTYELSKVDNFSATQNPETFCSKATAEEIINHFKNQKS